MRTYSVYVYIILSMTSMYVRTIHETARVNVDAAAVS